MVRMRPPGPDRNAGTAAGAPWGRGAGHEDQRGRADAAGGSAGTPPREWWGRGSTRWMRCRSSAGRKAVYQAGNGRPFQGRLAPFNPPHHPRTGISINPLRVLLGLCESPTHLPRYPYLPLFLSPSLPPPVSGHPFPFPYHSPLTCSFLSCHGPLSSNLSVTRNEDATCISLEHTVHHRGRDGTGTHRGTRP